MGDFIEFEEGEIGDLSDFEEGSIVDIRSQSLTPNEAEIGPYKQNNVNKDLRGHELNSQGHCNVSPKHRSLVRGDCVDGSDGRCNRQYKRPDSLLQLLSDDEGGIIPKSKGQKKKKKKRDWNPPGSRTSIAKKEKAPCRFYLEGRCHKGIECPFSHDFTQSKKQELCKFYATGSCSKGSSCSFLHGEFPCKFFHLSRNCYHGDGCKFSHRPLNPSSKMLLDRFINEKSSSSNIIDNAIPDRDNAITTGLIHQPVSQSGIGEPYGDIDYRRITSPSRPLVGGQMCPPQSGISAGFHPRQPFDYGPACSLGPHPQLMGYPPMRFPPNPSFPMNMPPCHPSTFHDIPNRPCIPLMNGALFRFRQPPPNHNGGFHPNSRSSHSDATVDALERTHNLSSIDGSCNQCPPQSSPSNVNVPTSPEHGVYESTAPPEEEVFPTVDEKTQHSVQHLTVEQDFVLPLQQAEKPEPSPETFKWHILPLDFEAKISYTSMVNTIHYIPNDPRLLPKLPVDPRLKTGSIRGPTVPVSPTYIEESIKSASITVVESNASEGLAQSRPVAFTGGKRRAKLQLNELANNFASGSSSNEVGSASSTSSSPLDRPYLLDPRLKRRRIVTTPQKAAEDGKPQVLDSPGASMQIAVHGPSA